MAAKKSTDVMIAGKVYTLSGYEEEGYLQRVASYINAKISEITDREEFRRIPNDMKSMLIQLNIADDYFKAKSQFEGMEENYKKAEKELFELKHELVDTQMKVEELLDKLDHERRERNQKTEREQQLEETLRKLEEKHRLLSNNAKVSEEKNHQFEEMLRLSEQERRELNAVNKELRLNKEKLESALADALLGAGKNDAAHTEDMDKNQKEHTKKKNQIKPKPVSAAVEAPVEQKNNSSEEKTAGKAEYNPVLQPDITAPDASKEVQAEENIRQTTPSSRQKSLRQPIPETPDESPQALQQPLSGIQEFEQQLARMKASEHQPKETVPAMAELSEEELEELLAPVDKVPEPDPIPAMAKLSEEELEELLAPTLAELSEEELNALLAPVKGAEIPDDSGSSDPEEVYPDQESNPNKKESERLNASEMEKSVQDDIFSEKDSIEQAADGKTVSEISDTDTEEETEIDSEIPASEETEDKKAATDESTVSDVIDPERITKRNAVSGMPDEKETAERDVLSSIPETEETAGKDVLSNVTETEETAGKDVLPNVTETEETAGKDAFSDLTEIFSKTSDTGGLSVSDTQEDVSQPEPVSSKEPVPEDALEIPDSDTIEDAFEGEFFEGEFSFDGDFQENPNDSPVTEHVKVRGSVMAEVSEEDGPELMEIARQIEEMERQELLEKQEQELSRMEKTKKKGKKKQKRKR